MSLLHIRPFSASVTWHLPEVLWHDATVELLDQNSPAGKPIVRWQVDSDFIGSSDPSRDNQPSWRAVAPGQPATTRVTVARHDGPRRVCVTIADSEGSEWQTIFTQNPR